MTFNNSITAGKAPARRSQSHARSRFINSRFIRSHGILFGAILALIIWTAIIWLISGAVNTRRTTRDLTAKYDEEYELRMQAFQNELVELNTPTPDQAAAAESRPSRSSPPTSSSTQRRALRRMRRVSFRMRPFWTGICDSAGAT